jgi:O-antigen/teichoic acid export membrane protein
MTLPKFFEKFNNKYFFSLAGNVIMSGLAFVIMSLLYRFLPEDAVGNWVVFQTVFTLVEMFRTGFLMNATIKFYSGTDKDRAAEVIGSAWILATGITFALLLLNIPALILVNVINIDKLGGTYFFLKWFGLSYLFSLPMFIATCVMQAEARFDRLLYMRGINQLSLFLFIVVLIFMDRLSLETLVYSNLVSLLITSIFVLLKGWTNLWAWKHKTKKGIIELYHFGKFSVMGNISAYMLRASDVFIINYMLGANAVAQYNIGVRLMEVIEIPLRSFIATAMPTMYAAFNRENKAELIYTMKKYAGMLTIALIPVCLGTFLFADFAVFLIRGKHHLGSEAANVLRLSMTFSLLFPADRFISLGIDAIHKPNINFVKILVMVAVNITTDFAGIAVFGNILGVALATVFPIIAGIWIGYLELRKYENFKLPQILSVGYAEMGVLLREKLKLKKSSLP